MNQARAENEQGKGVGWDDIFEHWAHVVPDLAEVYGVDLYDSAYADRPWPWLRGLILGLLHRSSALSRAVQQG